MKAKQLMVQPVMTATPAMPLKDAIERLAAHGISALPVVDEQGCMVGIVSESDLIQAQPGAGRPGAPSKVGDVMTTDVTSVDEDTAVPVVARCLIDARVRRVPVLRGEQVVGIISRRDLIKWMARSDASLAMDVAHTLRDRARQLAELEVIVQEGVVRFRGDADDEALATAATLARSVPGIVHVDLTPDDDF